MKLYKVCLTGMNASYGTSYVVARNLNEAYEIVRNYLDKNDLGFSDECCLESIQLLAETGEYPECKTRLYISKGDDPHAINGPHPCSSIP